MAKPASKPAQTAPLAPPAQHDHVLIIDFGSQVTQLIARRVRESGVYCEIHPYNKAAEVLAAGFNPKAVILSGGPASVMEGESPRAPDEVFRLGVPVLAILLRPADDGRAAWRRG